MLCMTCLVPMHLITGSWNLGLPLANSSYPLFLHLGTTNLISFPEFVCFWNIQNLQDWVSFYHIQYFYTIQNDHYHKCSYCLSPKIFHNYWLFSSHCTITACNSFILQLEVCTSEMHYLFLSPHPLLSGNHLFVYIYDYVSVLLCVFICFFFLDSTYKWNHTIFVFVWLISLRIIHSMFIHVVINGKILFFMSYYIYITFSLFYMFTIINNDRMNMRVYISFLPRVFIFFG